MAKKVTRASIERIEAARRELIKRGFRCLSGGPLGLPSYTHIEAWAKDKVLVYFLYDVEEDGWDLLRSIDDTNSVADTWEALDAILAQEAADDPHPVQPA